MCMAYYIVLDTDNPGFSTYVNGAAIAEAADDLDSIANRLSLPDLDDFLSLSRVEVGKILEDEFPLNDIEEHWFNPAEGIVFFERLIKYLQHNPYAFKNVQAVLAELSEYQKVLYKAFQINAKWHLSLDFWIYSSNSLSRQLLPAV